YPDEDAAETAVYDSRRWAMIKGDDGECHPQTKRRPVL
ncbi:hypothetical protein AD0028_2018, partial [Bifidobacterium adolescentis]